MKFTMPIGLTVSLLLLASGCSGSEEVTNTGQPPSPSASSSAKSSGTSKPQGDRALRIAFTTYADALFAGDSAAAYPMLSERCRSEVSASEFAAASEESATTDEQLAVVINRTKIKGDRAHVSATSGVPALDEDDPDSKYFNWVFEEGSWHLDQCD